MAQPLLGGAVLVGEGVELVHQRRRGPSTAHPAEIELAGIVADDDGIV